MEIIFVGISNKSKQNYDLEPLDQTTASGKIISLIENRLQKKCLKTNLVSKTPLDKFGKIRYPDKKEIEEGLSQCLSFIDYRSPCLVFLLGKIVEKAFLKEVEIQKLETNIYKYKENIFLSPIKHPSYIHTYKKGYLGEYIDEIESIVKKFI